MIEFIDVVKTYSNGVQAIKGISIQVRQGEFVYVVGASGAGKSTFIKMIYREEKVTEGKILINGQAISAIKNKKIPLFRRKIGVVFQDYKLIPTLTVYENVAFALEVIEESPANIRRKVMDVLELVKLKHKARSLPSELSGGEQQRVSIARSIVNRPKILIADEPTGNLDPTTTWEIMEILGEINNSGTTIVMATHNQEIVNTIKRRVITFEEGLIVRDQLRGGYNLEN